MCPSDGPTSASDLSAELYRLVGTLCPFSRQLCHSLYLNIGSKFIVQYSIYFPPVLLKLAPYKCSIIIIKISCACVCICVLVSSVQHFEAVLSQSELRQSGRGFDGGLLRVVFPYHTTQQRPAQSLSQPRLSNHVPLCTGQRAPPHHHPGSAVSVLVHTCTANITVKQIKNIDWSVVHGATIQPL